MREYVKIYCCGDCVYYNWKKHKCNRVAHEEGRIDEHFYRDCPMEINVEAEDETVSERWGKRTLVQNGDQSK